MRQDRVIILGTPAVGAAVFCVSAYLIRPELAGAGGMLGWVAGHVALNAMLNPGSLRASRFASEVRETITPKQLVVRSEIERGGYLKADFFRGLSAEQWHKCAVSIAVVENFTIRTVGQTEHPILVPMMLAAEYIEKAGQGMYNLTDDGLWFWKSLAARPYPWNSVPKNIATLTMDAIHTQYTQARRAISDNA